MYSSVGITASNIVREVTSKFVVNPDFSTELFLHYLEEVVFSVMNVIVGLEDKMLQIKTKHYMHSTAIRYLIFWAILSLLKVKTKK